MAATGTLTRNLGLALMAGLTLLLAQTQARAETAPDDFRKRVVDATLVCRGVFGRLSELDWPDRYPSEVTELQVDAWQKRDYALDMLQRYSAIYSGFDLSEESAKADRESGIAYISKEEVLDLAIYCETELFKLIDEEEQYGYTP
jgi:hypothetical protein